MALIKCKECGHEVSTEAQACPHCGAVQKKWESKGRRVSPFRERTPGRGRLVALLIVGGIILLVIIGSQNSNKGSSRSTSSPPQKVGLTAQGKAVQEALNEGKTCTATWGEDSSKTGQNTRIYAVRVEPSEKKTQYQVDHSTDYPRIWVWDFRLKKIECK